MSKLGNYLVPAIGGTAVLMGGAYLAAGVFAPADRLDVSGFAVSQPVIAPAPEAPAPAEVAEAAPEAEAEAPAQVAEAAPVEAPNPADILLGGGPELIQAAAPSAPEGGFGLGRPALEEEIAAWDIDVRPDGLGLPEGAGDVWTGEEVFVAKCAVCHGDFGEAVGRWPQLAGGQGTLKRDDPVKTIGSYWPYLSTVYDYVYRAMPFGEAQSLTPDEVYAITAYLLYVNDLVEDDFELSHENFAEVRLPNEDNFFMDDRAETELAAFSAAPCMSDCTDGPVEITMRSMVLDVTPDSGVVTEAAVEETPAEEAAPTETAAAEAPAEEAPATETEATEPEAEAVAALDPALVAEGEKVFRACASCHQVGDGARNRSGPVLTGIVGHPIGAVEGFRYSGAMEEKAGETWTEENLAAFLADPKGWLPGTKMSFRGLRSDEEIQAVIAYLASTGE